MPDTQALGWHCDECGSDEAQRLCDPPSQQTGPLPLWGTQCITFTASSLAKRSRWCSKIAATATHCSIMSPLFTRADSFLFCIKQGMLGQACSFEIQDALTFKHKTKLVIISGKEARHYRLKKGPCFQIKIGVMTWLIVSDSSFRAHLIKTWLSSLSSSR